MKKALIFSAILLLTIACQKAENILEINPDLPQNIGAANLPTVTSIVPANKGLITDQNGGQSGYPAQIEIIFSDFMDEATFTSSNIELWNTRTNTKLTSGITYKYYAEIRKLFIYITDLGTTGAEYLVRLVSGSSGVRNRYGLPIDFDKDSLADGTPYDDYLSTFYTTGGNPDSCVTTVWSRLGFLPGNPPDTVRTGNQTPALTIFFSEPMDTATLSTTNFSLTSEDGTPAVLNRTGVLPQAVTFTPSGPLTIGKNYILKVKCANVKQKVKYISQISYLLPLDGNFDGPEATEPDYETYFRVDSVIPPHVDQVTSIFRGITLTFSRLLDTTTVNLNTIQAFDDAGYIPGELRIYTKPPPDDNKTFVDYYFKRTPTTGRRVFISRSVKAAGKEYYLDGNGNEIGGEDWDDDYWNF